MMAFMILCLIWFAGVCIYVIFGAISNMVFHQWFGWKLKYMSAIADCLKKTKQEEVSREEQKRNNERTDKTSGE
jgi:hypothetical protein